MYVLSYSSVECRVLPPTLQVLLDLKILLGRASL